MELLAHEWVSLWPARISSCGTRRRDDGQAVSKLVVLHLEVVDDIREDCALVGASLGVQGVQTIEIGAGERRTLLLETFVDGTKEAHDLEVTQQLVRLGLAQLGLRVDRGGCGLLLVGEYDAARGRPWRR